MEFTQAGAALVSVADTLTQRFDRRVIAPPCLHWLGEPPPELAEARPHADGGSEHQPEALEGGGLVRFEVEGGEGLAREGIDVAKGTDDLLGPPPSPGRWTG